MLQLMFSRNPPSIHHVLYGLEIVVPVATPLIFRQRRRQSRAIRPSSRGGSGSGIRDLPYARMTSAEQAPHDRGCERDSEEAGGEGYSRDSAFGELVAFVLAAARGGAGVGAFCEGSGEVGAGCCVVCGG